MDIIPKFSLKDMDRMIYHKRGERYYHATFMSNTRHFISRANARKWLLKTTNHWHLIQYQIRQIWKNEGVRNVSGTVGLFK